MIVIEPVRVALIAAAVLGAGPAFAQRDAPATGAPSLVIAHWRDQHPVGAPCPHGEICTDVLVDARIDQVRVLSGPRVRSHMVVRVQVHAPPAAGFRPVLIIRPGVGDAPWQGQWVAIVPDGNQVCLDLATLRANGVPVPARGRVYDDRVCLPTGVPG